MRESSTLFKNISFLELIKLTIVLLHYACRQIYSIFIYSIPPFAPCSPRELSLKSIHFI